MRKCELKILKDLNKKINPPSDRIEEKDIPTYKDILIDSLSNIRNSGPGSGYSNIKSWQLAEKIMKADEVELDDADFELLTKIVESNPAVYFGWAHAQMMLKILDWEKS